MSGIQGLDWAALAVSFFNTGILIWLGFTVLLNSGRRNWGVGLAAGGLFIGAAFFVSHSAILGQKLITSAQGLNFWWHAGWGPVVAAPYAWYVLMLWYTGYWENRQSLLYRRHRIWLKITVIFTLLLAGLLVFGNPLPTLALGARFDFDQPPALLGIPILMVAYPIYILLCILLSLDALLHPVPSSRPFADTARQRARPWLTGATLLLLLASLLIGSVLFIVIDSIRTSPALIEFYNRSIKFLTSFDLLIASLIGMAVMMLGRAFVAYEIFTGHSLPRQALLRDWRRAIILCAATSLLSAWALISQPRPIYILLSTVVLIVTLYALVTWRSFVDHDAAIRQLRPFAASQGMYEKILSTQSSGPDENVSQALFTTLTRDVLNASKAALVPLGSLASLAPAMMVPDGAFSQIPTLEEIKARITVSQNMPIPGQKPDEWMIPLWNEEGLAGVLLLGEKQDRGFFSQEEIEIASAGGERLLDTRATAEMARRLVELQRERMIQSAVIDRRTRRVLHDDVLPRLHTALLQCSTHTTAHDHENQKTVELLTDTHRQISALLREMPPAAFPELTKRGVVDALHRVLATELAGSFDDIHWQVDPAAESNLASLPELTAEVIFFAAREVLRNAARHGRDSQNTECDLHLDIQIRFDNKHLFIMIEDNGVGFNSDPANPGGSGQGLSLHSTLMAVVGATMSIESEAQRFTRVNLKIPYLEKNTDSSGT